jgi:transcriptional regulator NrdR family protein
VEQTGGPVVLRTNQRDESFSEDKLSTGTERALEQC